MLTPKGVSQRTSKFHTEERLKYGVLPMDDLCRREAAWGWGKEYKIREKDAVVRLGEEKDHEFERP